MTTGATRTRPTTHARWRGLLLAANLLAISCLGERSDPVDDDETVDEIAEVDPDAFVLPDDFPDRRDLFTQVMVSPDAPRSPDPFAQPTQDGEVAP